MVVGNRRRSIRWFEAGLAFLMAAALLVVAPGSVPSARAATLQVGTPGDGCSDVSGTPYCTINTAIANANSAGGDTIEILDGTYNQTVFLDRDVTIEAVNPGAVTIDAAGAGRVLTAVTAPTATLRGLRLTGGVAASGAGVNVADGTFTIEFSEIEGNSASGNGGGIFVGSGTLNLYGSSVHGNNSTSRGGAIYNQSGTLDLFSSTISDNTSTQEGGAVYQQLGSAALQNLTVTQNGGSTGVFFIAGGTATIRNTVSAGNTAGSGNPACNGGGTITSLGSNFISRIGPICAGVFTAPGDIGGTPANPADARLGALQDNGGVGLSQKPLSDSPLLDAGDNTGLDATLDQLGNERVIDGIADGNNDADIGAIELDPLTVCSAGCDYTTVGAAISAAGNGDVVRLAGETFNQAGLVINADLQIQGDGSAATTIDAGSLNRVFSVAGATTAAIRDLTIQGGQAPADVGGGGINTAGDLTLERVRVVDNQTAIGSTGTGDKGGGIRQVGGTLTLRDSEVANNTAHYIGGGIYVTGGSSTTNVIRSTIANNAVEVGGAGIGTESSGGTTSALNVVNSTITGNTGGAGSLGGGGIYAFAFAPAELDAYISNSTISGNTSPSGGNGGGGIVVKAQVNLTVANSIIAANSGSPGPDCNSQSPLSFVSLGNNVIGNGDNCPQFVDGVSGDQVGTAGAPLDPQLGPLTDNGGFTETMLPFATSPAVNNGSTLPIASDPAACQLNDQRGVSRPDGAQCDVGAVEGFGDITLQALIDATSSGGTVNVPPGTYNENITIGDGKTLVGLGAAPGDTVIDGGEAGTTVTVLSGDVTIENLTIDGGASPNEGGGIKVDSRPHTVVLNNVQVVGSDAVDGGGVWIDSSIGLDQNVLEVNDSVITANIASGSGGAIYLGTDSTLIVDNSTIDNNLANRGAGIYSEGVVTVTGGAFVNNDAFSDGGAFYLNFQATSLDVNAPFACTVAPDVGSFIPLTTFADNDAGDDGGAIWSNSAVTVYGALFFNNTATYGGAVIEESGADLLHLGCSAFDGNAASEDGGAIGTSDDGSILVEDTLFSGNNAVGLGGAIGHQYDGNPTQVLRSIFASNGAASGGAIYSQDDLIVSETLFAGNGDVATTVSGGAITTDGGTTDVIDSTFDSNEAKRGGGVAAFSATAVSGSTFVGNFSDAIGPPAAGAALYFEADGSIVNSTLTGNSTDAGSGGAGIVVEGAAVMVNNATIVDNAADLGAAGIVAGGIGGSLSLSNSIVADNTSAVLGTNCSGVTSLGYNILGDTSCNQIGTDQVVGPLLGALQDNGGPTLTRSPLAGSPAIDAGNTPLSYAVFNPATLADWELNSATADNGELLLASGTFDVGSAFVANPIAADLDFTTQFQFRIAPDVGGGADGLTFSISDDPAALGQAGGFLGLASYDPIDDVFFEAFNGVAVEFDTWPNGPGEGANDSLTLDASNHIGVDIVGPPGDTVMSSVAFNPVSLPASLSDGSTWTAWVEYDAATSALDVYASNTGAKPASPTVSTVVDIAALTGPTAYVGFTGATGSAGLSGEQRIINFDFSQSISCEPLDQRGVVRPVGSACDIGAVEAAAAGSSLSVNLAVDGNINFGSPVIPIDDLDIGTFFGSREQPSSTQLGAIQLGAIQLGAIGSDLTSAGGHLTIGSIIDAAAELSAVPTILDEITLVDVPITGGWESILALSANLAGRPPYTVSLQNVIGDPAIRTLLDPPLEEIRLADSGVTASQLGAIQLGAIQLGAIQLGAIQLGAIQLGAIGDQLELICDDPADPADPGDTDCTALGIDPANTDTFDDYSIMALTLLGVDLDFAQLGAIQLGAIDPNGTQLGAIQLGAIQLGAIDIDALTIGNTQLGAIQLGAIQLGAIQLGAIQLGAIGSKANLVDYWCNDPAGGLNCDDLGVFEPAGGFAGDELDGYTILALGAMGADLAVLQLGAIQLGAIGNLESTQLGAIQLGAIQLGAINPEDSQLGAIQLGAIQLGAIQLGAIDWSKPVFAQLGAIQLGAIQLGAIDATGAPAATQLGAIQLGAIQLGAIDNIVDCTALAGGCESNSSMTLFDLQQAGLLLPGATLGDLAGVLEDIPLQVLADQGFDIVDLVGSATLLDLLPTTTIAELPDDLTLGDLAELWVGIPVYELLLALLDPADLSWEDVDPAVIAAENPAVSAGFSISFELSGDPFAVPEAEFPFTADVSITLPAGVSYVLGSSLLAVEPTAFPPSNNVPLADPEVDGSTLRWIVNGVELNSFNYLQFTLDTAFTAEAGVPIAATVSTLGLSAGDSVPTLVPDLEPQNNSFATAPLAYGIQGGVLIKDVLALGRIDPGSDIDLFKFEDLPAGSTIEVYLNPGESDLDIVLFEPGTTTGAELRGPAERVVDGSLDPTIGVDPTEQDQESLNDIANTDAKPVFKASLHRGNAPESIVTPPLREGGDYFLQVSGYQLVNSSDVYSGRIRALLPPNAEACAPRFLPFAGDGSPGTLPLTAELNLAETIYLINQELFADTYGSAALTQVLTAIGTVNSVPGAPHGVIVPVEGDTDVAAAYAAWLTADGNCSVDAANLVAQEIADLVDGYRATFPTVASVVVVGGDDQVPFFRVADQTTVANEREYETTFSGNNPLDAALRGGYVLTDAPMVDFNPLYVEQGDREIFVPNIPIGRLVEEPLEIVAALEQYVFAGGQLDVATATTPTAQVLGYDFLADASESIKDELELVQGYTVDAFISETWTKADLAGAFDSQSEIINGNAHYDHTAALPAAGNLAGTFNDLYTVDDLDPLGTNIYTWGIIYTMGCHAGLNAPGAYLNSTDDLYDWAQALLARNAVFIANTGFGYGDSDFQAYSEELMFLLTQQLGANSTIGEAHIYAAQLFAAQTPKWSPYHDKAMMEATLYGLPFYALTVGPVTPPTIPTFPTDPVGGGSDLESASFDATSNNAGYLDEQNTDDGDYFVADDVLAVPFRPVQPLEYIDATPSDANLNIRGAIIESGSTTDIGNFDVLYARPILYDQDFEPEFETTGAFPDSLQAVTSYQAPGGRADRVMLARGRYFPSLQVQQLWDEVGLTVYYAPGAPADVSPPHIALVSAVDQGGGNVNFTVTADDTSGVLRVLVLYKATGAPGAWTPLELTGPAGAQSGTWTGNATIPSGAGFTDYWVQVLGGDGQDASSTDKAELHEVLPPDPPSIGVTGPIGNNGIYRGTATVTLNPPANAPSAPLEVSVDGGATFSDYSSPVSITADGPFGVVGRLKDFSDVSVSVVGTIDATAPSVTVVDPSGPVEVAQGAALALRYFCKDDQGTFQSGIAKCKGTVVNGGLLDTSILGVRTAQVTATDRAGNVTTVNVPYTVTELEPVTVSVDASLVPIDQLVTFTAEFAGSSSSVEWWFGDGNDFLTGAAPDQSGNATTVQHAYIEPGVYPVTVRVTDSTGLARLGTYHFIVVYDPSGGFVTGGGWFYTPEGAFTPEDSTDPEVTGRAKFGFSSKYEKGASVPTGSTTFKLDANGFKFESTSYDWLVVSGSAKAQYQGVGEIKGWDGLYDFRITLRDADGNDNDSFVDDAIRVRIWAEDGTVIYDNGYGQDDTTVHGGTQAIEQGSIKIHVPKGGKGPT